MDDHLKLFFDLDKIFTKKSIVILGAGVSVGYVEPKYDLYEYIKNDVISKIMFQEIKNTNILDDTQAKRLQNIGSNHKYRHFADGKVMVEQSNFDIRDQMIHLYPEIVDLYCGEKYSLKKFISYCPSYQFFNLINKKSLILNLNHDNIGEQIINKVELITMHGSVTPKQNIILNTYISNIFDVNVRPEFLKDLYLLKKENESLLINSPSYKYFFEKIKNCTFDNLIIIGYTFYYQNGINDILLYELIKDYLKTKKLQLIMIDLDPTRIPDLISSDMSLFNLYMYKLNWKAFCDSFFQLKKFNTCSFKKSIFLLNYLIRFTKKGFRSQIWTTDNIKPNHQ